MGKKSDVALEVLKVGGYLTIGGVSFYLLSGGKLPFQVTFVVITIVCDCPLPARVRASIGIAPLAIINDRSKLANLRPSGRRASGSFSSSSICLTFFSFKI